MKIVYVGLKEQKADNVAGTGLVWTRGEIHEVEDEVKAQKLLAHPLIWQDASKEYELIPAPAAVKPEPRASIIPTGEASPYWEPIVLPIPADIFARVQKKELVACFMTPADADRFAEWKLANPAPEDTAPQQTGPKPDITKLDKRSKEYKAAMASQGLDKKAG